MNILQQSVLQAAQAFFGQARRYFNDANADVDAMRAALVADEHGDASLATTVHLRHGGQMVGFVTEVNDTTFDFELRQEHYGVIGSTTWLISEVVGVHHKVS